MIPESVHLIIHSGPGGGLYNAAWIEELNKIGGPRNATVADILRIRDDLTKRFGISRYRPPNQFNC
jgi:hypothetical protein